MEYRVRRNENLGERAGRYWFDLKGRENGGKFRNTGAGTWADDLREAVSKLCARYGGGNGDLWPDLDDLGV